MKLSFNWLKELVDIPWSPEETADKLAQLGFPVESMSNVGVRVSDVVAVKILSVSKHPNADRLQIAQVTDGKQERTIVCGAPNIAAGQIVPCALPGAKLPGGVDIVVSKIRGVESQGMLCSERELQLSDSHAGIMQLPAGAPLGTQVKDLLGGADTVLEIEITPNRPDMMSHVGVARELAALAELPLKLPEGTFSAKSGGAECSIQIDEPVFCARYMGKIFHGVQVKASPDWMVRRLKACGIRSINNIVDITNYVLLEWGHPLHAFDLAKLDGKKIIVRRASKGEKILALDEKTYALEESDLVIADGKNPVAIAGIMGGQSSGVIDDTVDILLESAVFDRVAVRQTSRRLALRSESSVRFEKGTDAGTAELASLRAAQLIQELSGAKAGREADVYPVKEKSRSVSLRKERLALVLGFAPEDAAVLFILKNLGLNPGFKNGVWSCDIPSYRKDLIEEIDLIEEVIRLVGYNSVPAVVSRVKHGQMSETYRRWNDGELVSALKGFGLNETMTNSFSSSDFLAHFGIQKSELVLLANPVSKEETAMRPLLASNLIKAAQHNLNFQRDSVSLFEIGKVFRQNAGKVFEERKLSFIVCGKVNAKSWSTPEKEVDVFYLKGLLEALRSAFKLDVELVTTPPASFLHPYQSFEIKSKKQTVGWAGMLHPALALQLDLTAPCALAEFNLDVFRASSDVKAGPLPKYPFVERDIAVIVDKKTLWADLYREVEKSGGSLLTGVHPFDIFEGGSLAPTQKSVAFRVRLQHPEHTLSDAEITQTIDKIKTSIQKTCGAQLR